MANLAEMLLPYMTTDNTQNANDFANSFQQIIHALLDNKHFAKQCYDISFGNESKFEAWETVIFEKVKNHLELDKLQKPKKKIKNDETDEKD